METFIAEVQAAWLATKTRQPADPAERIKRVGELPAPSAMREMTADAGLYRWRK